MTQPDRHTPFCTLRPMGIGKMRVEDVMGGDNVLVNGAWWFVESITCPVDDDFVLQLSHRESFIDHDDLFTCHRNRHDRIEVDWEARDNELFDGMRTRLRDEGFTPFGSRATNWGRQGFIVQLFDDGTATLLSPAPRQPLAVGRFDDVLTKYREIANGRWLPQWLKR